jgi:glutamine transport system permease protein
VIRLDYVFNWEVVTDHWREFLAATWLDVWIAVLGFAVACTIGLFLAICRVSRAPLFRIPALIYVELIRGVPLYVFLLWVYFGLDAVTGVAFTAYQAMVITLGAIGSGYTAEIFRAGIQAIDRGQSEGAEGLGLTRTQIYRHVIMPQALPIVIPPLGNIFIQTLKGSTVMSLIALQDIVFQAADINVRYFTPFEAFSAPAVILITLVFIFSGVLFVTERALRVR